MKVLLENKLKEVFPEINFLFSEFREELTIEFDPTVIVEVCDFLKNDEEFLFNLCEDVTAIDWAVKKNRFTVVYHLFSMKNKFRLRLKCNITDAEAGINSVCSVWKSANWAEREVYDMFGIKFINHPDLRRMYMPEEFEYHPLRKDFPLMGIPGSLPLPKK